MSPSDSSPMTALEESIAFNYILGEAIAKWADVERALLWIVTSCFTEHDHINAAIFFFSIENFRSKLQSADRLFNAKFGDTPHKSQWDSHCGDLDRLSQLRNHLVHYHAQAYAGKPGRRIALIPPRPKESKLRQIVPKPPSGSLCLREIAHARIQFSALAYGLEILVSHATRQTTQLSASLAQADDAPTMAQLTHQIRAILSARA